jgi:predicted nucleic acid-binding protein
MNTVYRIYLDVCCLHRPFDDQAQLRVHLETEAVLAILKQCEEQHWKLISSDALEAEIAQISNPEQLQQVKIALQLAHIRVLDSPSLQARIAKLTQMRFSFYDAAHIASAEKGRADILLSTDDRLVRRAKRFTDTILVKTDNPLNWLTTITDMEK